ncbi:MAG: putative thiolase, partial [Verrucomicrobiaceae bacterium]|nr:putative thiolase [Verrucomicrobiaceae bacterium]
DVIEINEAFAAQVLAVMKCVQDKASARRCRLEEPLGEIDPAKLNARGGAIALGHPVGATGARLVLSALHQLRDTRQRRAMVSLCVGGGQGGAAILECL